MARLLQTVEPVDGTRSAVTNMCVSWWWYPLHSVEPGQEVLLITIIDIHRKHGSRILHQMWYVG